MATTHPTNPTHSGAAHSDPTKKDAKTVAAPDEDKDVALSTATNDELYAALALQRQAILAECTAGEIYDELNTRGQRTPDSFVEFAANAHKDRAERTQKKAEEEAKAKQAEAAKAAEAAEKTKK